MVFVGILANWCFIVSACISAGDTIGYNIDGVIFPSIAEIQAEQNTYRDSLIAQFFPSEAQQNQLQLDSLAIINMSTSIRNIDIGLGFGGSSL